jgi:hypothetical protein
MAITFDAPSANWATESRLSSEPRIIYPIQQNKTAIFYEQDFAINQANFATGTLDTAMASTTLTGGIGASDTVLPVVSTAGFPSIGKVKIDSETIPYTAKTSTSFTGATVTATHTSSTAVDSIAYLVEETMPRALGGEMVEWTKKFATIPDSWSDYNEGVFTFPGYYNDDAVGNFRSPQSLNATIKSTTAYALTTDPYTDLDVANQMFRVVNDATDLTVLQYVDASSIPTYTTYTGYVSGGTLIYVAQSTLERFAGNIWGRTQFQTKAQ